MTARDLEPPISWCYRHGRTIVDCYQTDGTVTVERECELNPAKVRGHIMWKPDETLDMNQPAD